MLERATTYQYVLVRRLGYEPHSYSELRQIVADVDDPRVPGHHPAFVERRGDATAMIAARRSHRYRGANGARKSRGNLVGTWKKAGGPAWEVDQCEVCGLLLMRGTSPKSKRVAAHQVCWRAVQRTPEGRAWMAAYMARARRGRRGTVAGRPYTPRRGRRASPEVLTRHFGWTVRNVLGGEALTAVAESAFTSRQAVDAAVKRILSLLPQPDIADRSLRPYVLALTAHVYWDSEASLPPLRASRAACGTQAGYKRHRRLGEDACESCKAAERERTRLYSEKRRREAGILPKGARCGTSGGYRSHKSKGEPPCPECRDARNAYQREYYARHLDRARARGRANQAKRRAGKGRPASTDVTANVTA
jgi:hypothetical protein